MLPLPRNKGATVDLLYFSAAASRHWLIWLARSLGSTLASSAFDPELLGAPLFRGHAEFGSNGIRVNQLLGEARFGEYERRHKHQMEK